MGLLGGDQMPITLLLLLLLLLLLQASKSVNVDILAKVYLVHLKVKHCQTLHLQVKMSRPFLTGKSIVLYFDGGQNYSKNQYKITLYAQLTDFDLYSYLPLKFRYSRRVKKNKFNINFIFCGRCIVFLHIFEPDIRTMIKYLNIMQ